MSQKRQINLPYKQRIAEKSNFIRYKLQTARLKHVRVSNLFESNPSPIQPNFLLKTRENLFKLGLLNLNVLNTAL